MSLSNILSFGIFGIEGYPVRVEVDVRPGLAVFSVVGLGDASVKESRERVMAAIRNNGFEFPARRITANLAPADRRKEGSGFDLPIAIGILAASGQVPSSPAPGDAFLGELALDGRLRPVRGALSCAMTAARRRTGRLFLPDANVAEARLVGGVDVVPVSSLAEAVGIIAGSASPRPEPVCRPQEHAAAADEPDLSDVCGQAYARRALEIAAAGGHNLLMVGPPGSGKTMLARRLPGIMPELCREEALEVLQIWGVAGRPGSMPGLDMRRPFRAPHHTIPPAALIGGGRPPFPGEVSLAHHGVLFLDEIAEFGRESLESLRQPLEDGRACVSRLGSRAEFPANFTLVAACNPCPCGWLGDPRRPCRCGPMEIKRYRRRMSGPLMDRIDMCVDVPAVKFSEFDGPPGESSESVRARVVRCRARQRARYGGSLCNAVLRRRQVREFCASASHAGGMVEAAFGNGKMTARGMDQALKVSLTIADLEGSENISPAHLAEALSYRDTAMEMGGGEFFR